MNLVRLGHYFTPSSGDEQINTDPFATRATGLCQTALVVGPSDVSKKGNDYIDHIEVNLKVWDQDGDEFIRLGVRVDPPDTEGATFHLSGDCPWKR